MVRPEFRFEGLKAMFEEVLKNNYKVLTCEEYVHWKKKKTNEKIFVNRIDIETSCRKAKNLAQVFNSLNIKASFFIRLHAEEYNPFSFENYRCLKYIRDTGHELAYHSEIVDQAAIWDEDVAKNLVRDINVINHMFDIKIAGVASHGGYTGLNNLDFWNNHKPSEFGLLYEGYDREPEFNLFYESIYISDSNIKWKCYNNGILMDGVSKTLAEHSKDGHPALYSLIHPEYFFTDHIYEQFCDNTKLIHLICD